MIVPIEKPGSPEALAKTLALEHVGVKGMRWGHHKDKYVASKPKSLAVKKTHRKEVAKKVAIGAGTVAVVAGAGYVAYKLHQNSSSRVSDLNPSTIQVGKQHLQSLYVTWVNVQANSIGPNLVGAALDFTK